MKYPIGRIGHEQHQKTFAGLNSSLSLFKSLITCGNLLRKSLVPGLLAVVFHAASFSQEAVAKTGLELRLPSYDLFVHNNFSSAVELPLNTVAEGILRTPAEQDFYRFSILRQERIQIRLNGLPADYDLKLYNGLQKQIGISQFSGDKSESISLNASEGTYYLHIYGYNHAYNTNRPYFLEILTTKTEADRENNADYQNVIKIFPNPAQSVIDISACKIPAESFIKVFDMHGKTVISRSASLHNEVDIRKLTPGAYFVQIEDANENVAYSSKFVKD